MPEMTEALAPATCSIFLMRTGAGSCLKTTQLEYTERLEEVKKFGAKICESQ
jgi:hypothetical protein